MLVTDTKSGYVTISLYKYSVFRHVVKKKVPFSFCFRWMVVRVAGWKKRKRKEKREKREERREKRKEKREKKVNSEQLAVSSER